MTRQGRLAVEIEIPDGETIPVGTTVYSEDYRLEAWMPDYGFVYVDDDEVRWESDRQC